MTCTLWLRIGQSSAYKVPLLTFYLNINLMHCSTCRSENNGRHRSPSRRENHKPGACIYNRIFFLFFRVVIYFVCCGWTVGRDQEAHSKRVGMRIDRHCFSCAHIYDTIIIKRLGRHCRCNCCSLLSMPRFIILTPRNPLWTASVQFFYWPRVLFRIFCIKA